MTPERNAVAPEMPIARSPSQMNAPRQMPQTSEVKPGLKAGGRGGKGTPPTLVSRAATCAAAIAGWPQKRGSLLAPAKRKKQAAARHLMRTKKIRRAGGAFVHFPGQLSACAYNRPVKLQSTRAPCSAQSALWQIANTVARARST